MNSRITPSAIVFCVIGFSLCSAGLNDEEFFLQAHKLYKDGAYAQAREKYQAIEHKGYAVWFNLGNCAYHEQDYVQAYTCWLRAEREAPAYRQSALEHNYAALSCCNGVTPLKRSWTQQCVMRTSIIFVQLCAVVAWFVFWWLVAIGYWRTRKFIFIGVGVLTLVCGILAAACCQTWWQQRAVTRHKVVLYAGPNEKYHAVGAIDGISAVVLHDARDAWYKVAHNGTVGWISEREVIVV